MNEGDFGLMFWQVIDKFVIEVVEVVEHDAFILATRLE